MLCLRCKLEVSNEADRYGLHPKCFVAWFKVDADTDFLSLTQRSAQSSSQKNPNYSPNNTSFYHGKFKKYSADLGTDNYILKMRMEKEGPELPEVEYLCNQIGSLVGLPVADHFYINFYSELVFVTKVFIKKGSATANLDPIHKYRPDDKHDCETLAKTIEETTKRPYDVDVFYNTVLFDALIGNNDRHGGNLAFIVTPSKTVLSPIYDNVSNLGLFAGPILNADIHPTGRIATLETKEPSMKDYVKELKRLGQGSLVEEFANKVKVPKIEELIENSYCTPLMKAAMKRLLLKRHKELADGL
ncbi:MAG: HipA domain-containing protein [Bdellovibrionota bacterium]